MALKKLPVLMRGITSKHQCNSYCLNYLHSFATKNKFVSHIKVCEKKNCNNVMPSEGTKILEFNQCQKSDKAPYIINAYLESLIKRLIYVKICKKNIHHKSK